MEMEAGMADGKAAYSFENRQPIVVDGKFISRLYPMKDKNLRINDFERDVMLACIPWVYYNILCKSKRMNGWRNTV